MESLLFRAKGREEVEHRQVLMKSFGGTRSLESGNFTGKLNFKSRVLSSMMLKSSTCLASGSRGLAVGAGGQHLLLQGREQGRPWALGPGTWGLNPHPLLSVSVTLGE